MPTTELSSYCSSISKHYTDAVMHIIIVLELVKTLVTKRCMFCVFLFKLVV